MPSIKLPKYLKIELIFFITYFYVFRFITDFEYNFWERKKTGISLFEVEYNLLYGTTSLIAFWVFYQIVKQYLVHKRAVSLIMLCIVFLISYSLYAKCVNYLFAHLDFLSAELREMAMRHFKSKSIGYSIAYMMKEFLAVGFLAYFIHVDQQNERLKVLREQQFISELTYLKAQLQPHFFFNTLNNIYSLALQQSNHTAPLIAKLAEMMRYILYKSEQQFVPLRDEINFIRNYVEVEKVRYRSAIKIDFDVQGAEQAGEIGPLLLLPFVENAFKHGIQEEQNEGFVKIVICNTENELVMEVSNSIAIPQKISGGIGLMNVRKRLAILYPEKHQLNIHNSDNIFQVSLILKTK